MIVKKKERTRAVKKKSAHVIEKWTEGDKNRVGWCKKIQGKTREREREKSVSGGENKLYIEIYRCIAAYYGT